MDNKDFEMTVWIVMIGNRAEQDLVGIYDYKPTIEEAKALALEAVGEHRFQELTKKLNGGLWLEQLPVESRESIKISDLAPTPLPMRGDWDE